MKILKQIFLGFARIVGYDRYLLRYLRTISDTQIEVMQWLFKHDKKLLYIDVGANTGQTIDIVKNSFPSARIHSFEPTPSLKMILRERYEKDPNIHLYFYALGDHNGRIQLHTSEYSPTNSVLAADPSIYREFGNDELATKFEQERLCEVEISTLAVWTEKHLNNSDTVDVLKIDTQGYDFQVLEGAGPILNRTKMVVIEAQFQNFYRNATSWTQSYELLYKYGFYLLDIFSLNKFNDTVLMECDMIFVNTSFFPPDSVRKEQKNM